MSIKQISVFLENQAGTLQAMTASLADKGIDMRALSLVEASDFGIVRLIVDDVYAASNVLKSSGFVHNIASVLGVCIPDEPGGLNRVLQILFAAGVNIEYMYAFLGGNTVDHAYMIFKVADYKGAAAALRAKGIHLVDQEEISAL